MGTFTLLAVKINNIGVELLHLGAFNQAAITLRDAASMLKDRDVATAEVKLRLAEARLSSPKPNSWKLAVHVVSEDDEDWVRASSDDYALSLPIRPIRFEHWWCEDVPGMDASLVSATVLINYAYSHLCLYKDSVDQAYPKSSKIFQLAETILSLTEVVAWTPKLLLITLNVKSGMLQVLIRMGRTDEVKDYISQLAVLRQVATKMQEAHMIGQGRRVAPAA